MKGLQSRRSSMMILKPLRIQREKFQKEGKTEKVQQTDRSIAQATKMKGESLMGFDYEQLKNLRTIYVPLKI